MLMGTGCKAQETCKPGRPIGTPAGDLTITRCTDTNKYPTRKYLSVGGIKLLETRTILAEEAFDKDRARWIFSGDPLQGTGCSDRLYLIDFSEKPLKVIAFGVKKACNEFQGVNWGVERSSIILKKNVKFVYENGKMTLPSSGANLWNSIEAPHAGTGLDLKDAKAFSENVTLPN